MGNHLRDSLSPYLRQHADNPVDWWPWCDEAFAEACHRDVPILLSVGYAACHWCHVMAHESFDDQATAALMNGRFVSIKVDREERPDIDAVYMAATQALTGGGGWPMTVFLDHDQRAFYAGTYFPPVARFGMPSLTQVLLGVDQAWRTDRDGVLAAAAQIDAALEPANFTGAGAAPAPPPPSGSDVRAAVDRLAMDFDPARGGFGGAPKFPPSMVLEFLLRADALGRRSGQPDGRALEMAAVTMAAMARGGMYDQIAGGFARYSVDAGWVVPHFEKMLYDNALLLRAYLHWWRATGDELAERVARETAQFLVAELRTAEGGFASSLDADSEGREGAYYVWTPQQLEEVLGPEDGGWVAQLCRATSAGTFEAGASVLQLPVDPDDSGRWRRCRSGLAHARGHRPRPARDDKVVAAWNGLVIAALAEAGALLDEPGWMAAAEACADLLLTRHWDSATRHLLRVSLAGEANPAAPGVLDDYADLAEGLLALYQVTGRQRWYDSAQELLSVILERFPDGRGGFYDTANDAPRLVRRPHDPGDGVTPSGSAAAACALLAAASLSGSMGQRVAAEQALAVLLPTARAAPRFAGWAWAGITAALAGPMQVGVVLPRTGTGRPDDPDMRAPARAAGTQGPATRVLDPLHLTALRSTSPGLVVAAAVEGGAGVGLLRDRPTIGGVATAYPCHGFVCDLPVNDPAALRASLGDAVPP